METRYCSSAIPPSMSISFCRATEEDEDEEAEKTEKAVVKTLNG
jgi:hypothetical protein